MFLDKERRQREKEERGRGGGGFASVWRSSLIADKLLENVGEGLTLSLKAGGFRKSCSISFTLKENLASQGLNVSCFFPVDFRVVHSATENTSGMNHI